MTTTTHKANLYGARCALCDVYVPGTSDNADTVGILLRVNGKWQVRHNGPCPAVTHTTETLSDNSDTWSIIPVGRYALGADTETTEVKFYRVTRGKDGGRWAGKTFVRRLFGSPGAWRQDAMSYPQQATVLDTIAADVEGASRLFGRKYETCGMCASPLSLLRSRASGYGETCAGNHGLPYVSRTEALAMVERGEVSSEGITDL